MGGTACIIYSYIIYARTNPVGTQAERRRPGFSAGFPGGGAAAARGPAGAGVARITYQQKAVACPWGPLRDFANKALN